MAVLAVRSERMRAGLGQRFISSGGPIYEFSASAQKIQPGRGAGTPLGGKPQVNYTPAAVQVPWPTDD